MKLIKSTLKAIFKIMKTPKQTPATRITNIKKIFRQYDLEVHILQNGKTRMKVSLHKGNQEVFFKIIKAYFKNESEFIDARNYILKFDIVKKESSNNSFSL